jgi:L-ascorbate metabolism protein UlaG (beta-lactamase superfamily)
MKIKWYGQAAFLIISDSGTRIITDPYTPGGFGLNYAPIAEDADIVTISHDHADHANVDGIEGSPVVVRILPV